MVLAVHARRVGLQIRQRRPEIKRPPAPASLAAILTRAAPPAHTAAVLLPRLGANGHHDRLQLDADVLDHGPLDPEQHLPYPSPAHAATALSHGSKPSAAGTVRARRRAPSSARSSGASRPDVIATKRGRTTPSSSANHLQSTTTTRAPQPTVEALLDGRRPAALPALSPQPTPGNSTSATYPGKARKAIYLDADGNEIGFGGAID